MQIKDILILLDMGVIPPEFDYNICHTEKLDKYKLLYNNIEYTLLQNKHNLKMAQDKILHYALVAQIVELENSRINLSDGFNGFNQN
jgi:hypothetical protein